MGVDFRVEIRVQTPRVTTAVRSRTWEGEMEA